MGIPGAGKSRLVAGLTGYERLNRDDRGGSLAALARELGRRLGQGARRLVLDNTYLTRASRNLVVETSARHGAGVRCVWLDTPLAQAQVNLVRRQLDLFGRLPKPEELRALAKSHPGLMAPTSQLRAVRQLEPPAEDEGFGVVERVPFRRDPASGVPGVFVAADAAPGFQIRDTSVPHLVFGWHVPPGVVLPGAVVASCPHPGGPPACGAGRRCRGSCSPSAATTEWIPPARCSWERARAIAPWRPPWAPGSPAPDEPSPAPSATEGAGANRLDHGCHQQRHGSAPTLRRAESRMTVPRSARPAERRRAGGCPAAGSGQRSRCPAALVSPQRPARPLRQRGGRRLSDTGLHRSRGHHGRTRYARPDAAASRAHRMEYSSAVPSRPGALAAALTIARCRTFPSGWPRRSGQQGQSGYAAG